MASAKDCRTKELYEILVSVEALRGGVSQTALLPGDANRLGLGVQIEQCCRRKPHQGPIPGLTLVGRAGKRIPGSFEALQSFPRRPPDVETRPSAGIFARAVPRNEAVHGVERVEAFSQDEAFCQGKGHSRIVCPLAGLKAERAVARHLTMKVCEPFDPGSELEGRAEGVANRKAEYDAPGTVEDIGSFRLGRGLLGAGLHRPELLAERQ